MTVLTHALDRSLVIRAGRDAVFRFFTDTTRWAAWWGAGSLIEPRSGGQVRIRYPDGTIAAGEVIEIAPPARLVFSYGYENGKMIPVGGSRVTIRLDPHGEGTLLQLRHEFADAAVRDEHVQGWRYQLSLFANAVSNEVNAGAPEKIDRWFDLWSTADEHARNERLTGLAAPAIQLRDRFSAIDGRDEVAAHIGAALRFMPGVRMARAGDVRHCQGAALADWEATDASGASRGAGSNLFVFGPDGRITSVTGFWR